MLYPNPNLFYKSKSMRKSITLFDDQYAFYKELKSERLLIAFVEYMFEDIEPHDLNSMEQIIRNSLLERMNNWKWKSDAGKKSKGGWRPKKTEEEKQQKNNRKTTNKQQVEDISISRSISNKIEDKVKVEEDKKNKYLDFVYLSELEHQKLIQQLWQRLTDELIDKLNNYIWSTWKKYKSHYFTILNRSKKEQPHTKTNYEMERQAELHRQKIREQIESFNSENKQNAETWLQDGWYNRRQNIRLSDISW